MKDVRVVEIGDRIAAGACGSLLASLGAETILVEPRQPRKDHKWATRAVTAAGKHSVCAELQNELVASLLATADVVIASSDVSPIPPYVRPASQIVCDITGYGSGPGPSGAAPSDALIQAVTGMIDTTGEPAKPPVAIDAPLVETIAALYATAGIQAALRVRDASAQAQNVEIALYDCAFSTLTTFLSFHFAGKQAQRSGNRHILAAPWNCYQTRDGWLVICTGTDEQWKRLCSAMDSPGLFDDPRFQGMQARTQRNAELDHLVQAWTASLTVADCFEHLRVHGIACGQVVPARELAAEPNLRHRQALVPQTDPVTHRNIFTPGFIIKTSRHGQPSFTKIPMPDADRPRLESELHRPRQTPHLPSTPKPMRVPLAGIRVLEVGQFTTAPFIARQLAGFGAEVIKVEPPGGDSSRGWAPGKNGQSYFFSASNCGKRSICLNLRDDADRETFRALLAQSDVLVENLKPGALENIGFGPTTLAALNPRLVYCAVSGFGADSAYPGRAAFDTVVQAMSGIMDLTRQQGMPQKTGISSADILGGLFGLIATLDALAMRDLYGRGEQIDVAMQDASAWLTLWRPPDDNSDTQLEILPCRDGYVAALVPKVNAPRIVPELSSIASARLRAEAVACLAPRGVTAAPVLPIREVAESAPVRQRNLLFSLADPLGREWPLIHSPIRLSATPVSFDRAIGPLGEANEEIRNQFLPNRTQSETT